MKLKLDILDYDITHYKSYVFYFQCPTAFVATATEIFHRLIMGKAEILFLQKCLFNGSSKKANREKHSKWALKLSTISFSEAC